MSDADCCGRTCLAGVCDDRFGCCRNGGLCPNPPGCSPDRCDFGACALSGSIGDSPCAKPEDCVTDLCTAGHCNRESPSCPSGPGSCENCLAMNCCDAESMCTSSPSCSAFLGCFRRCTRSGGTRDACAMQCGGLDNTAAFMLMYCATHRCRGSCN
jgi:hypothetical protein